MENQFDVQTYKSVLRTKKLLDTIGSRGFVEDGVSTLRALSSIYIGKDKMIDSAESLIGQLRTIRRFYETLNEHPEIAEYSNGDLTRALNGANEFDLAVLDFDKSSKRFKERVRRVTRSRNVHIYNLDEYVYDSVIRARKEEERLKEESSVAQQ